MVFCNTKYTTGTLANQLAGCISMSIACTAIFPRASANRIMQRFKAGEIAVLVATDVAARGIDVSDVDAVVNYDVPEENEHYTHRIGRTGRAKKEGASYLFYTKDEQKRVDTLLRLTRNAELCRDVHFDFNHEHLVVEQAKSEDRFRSSAIFNRRTTPGFAAANAAGAQLDKTSRKSVYWGGISCGRQDKPMNPLILQSDFGYADGAVSAMYGVALGVSPTLRVFDLTHDIPPV